MCGIVGIVSKRNNGFFSNEIQLWEELLLIDQLRGDDSTGAFGVLKNRQIKSIKIGSHAQDLFRTEGWRPFRSSMLSTGQIVIGHNRKATRGAVNSKNAHPFHEGPIHLVHNGTLFNHKSLTKATEVDVDSHAVCHALGEKDVEEVIKEIEGAFAFVWFDRRTNKLYAVRNKERPLCLIETENIYILVSEMWMAMGVCMRNNIKVESAKPKLLEPGELLEFDLAGNVKSRTIGLRAPATTTYYNYYSGGHHHRRWHDLDDDEDTVVMDLNGRRGSSNVVTPFRAANESTTPTSTDTSQYETGDVVLVVVNSARLDSSCDRVKIAGLITMPNLPQVAVEGFMPRTFKVEQMVGLAGRMVSAVIRLKGKTGPMLVGDIILEAPTVKLWEGDNLLPTEWEHLCENVTCSKCKEPLDAEMSEMTSVKREGNMYRVVCPVCVEKALPAGEKKDEFQSRCATAVQTWKSVRQTTGGDAASDATQEGATC